MALALAAAADVEERRLLTTIIGVLASICTTVSYIPQLKKAWLSGQTDDLSLRMLSCLAVGIALWVLYGIGQSDLVIIGSNSISLAFLCAIIVLKLRRDRRTY